MGLFDWLSLKKKEVSIQEMRNLTEKWASDYTQNYRVSGKGVMEHELYMFCGWIVWDYMLNNGYLPENAHETYLPFIHEKVNKVKKLSDDEFYSFYGRRFKLYKSELRRLRTSDRPYLMETLYGALYKSMFLEEDTYYDAALNDEIGEICEFMDKFIAFWNKVNKELLSNYKRKK